MIKRKQFGASTLSGVKVVVPVVSLCTTEEPDPLSEERLQAQVEDTLRKAGIEIVDQATAEENPNAGLLCVAVVIEKQVHHLPDQTPVPIYAVVVQVTHEETVRLYRDDNILTRTATWSKFPIPDLMILQSGRLEREDVPVVVEN